jgi:hypothetical protein
MGDLHPEIFGGNELARQRILHRPLVGFQPTTQAAAFRRGPLTSLLCYTILLVGREGF